MIRIPLHRSVIAGIILLTFLFSANGLLFGSHLAEEMLSEAARIVGDDHGTAVFCGHHSSSHHHGHGHHHSHHHHSHTDSECCGAHGHHSHDFRSGQPLVVTLPFSFSQRRFYEIDAYIPEVYLDRFIPPQNPA